MNRYQHLMACGLVMSALWLPAGHAAGAPVSGPAARDQTVAIQLGKVTVRGEKQIIETLQAIKVALNQPNSSDPRLANVVVCRLRSKMGSHVVKLLTCATNNTLNKRRSITQLAMDNALASPGDCGIACVANSLNEVLAGQRSHVLRVPVNEGALQALLAKVPLPIPRTATPAVGKIGH